MKKGNCYQVNAEYMLDHINDKNREDVLLVHGLVAEDRHGHCWIELHDMCLDVSNGKSVMIRKERYYALGLVVEEECNKYDLHSLKKMLVSTGHWGPWAISEEKTALEIA